MYEQTKSKDIDKLCISKNKENGFYYILTSGKLILMMRSIDN